MKKEQSSSAVLIVTALALGVIGVTLISAIKSETACTHQIEQLSILSNAKSLRIIALKNQLISKDAQLNAIKKDLGAAKSGLDAAAKKIADLTAPTPVAPVAPPADQVVK